TFALRGRELPLTVYGPRGLGDLLASLRRGVGKLTYELKLVEVESGAVLERDGYRLAAVPVAPRGSPVGRSPVGGGRPRRLRRRGWVFGRARGGVGGGGVSRPGPSSRRTCSARRARAGRS